MGKKTITSIFLLIVMIPLVSSIFLVNGANTPVKVDDEGNHFSAPNITIYGSDKDDCIIGITVNHQLGTDGATDDHSPFLSPLVQVHINPDIDRSYDNLFASLTEYNYIQSVKLTWKLKNPSGNYLPYHKIDEGLQFYRMADNIDSQYLNVVAKYLYKALDAISSKYPPAKIGKYMFRVEDSKLDSGHTTSSQWVKWKDGKIYCGSTGTIPRNSFKTFGLMVDFESILGQSAYGRYTLQLQYEVVVNKAQHTDNILNEGSGVNSIYHAFTLTGSTNIYFEYTRDGTSNDSDDDNGGSGGDGPVLDPFC
jgi:hypothetical protein